MDEIKGNWNQAILVPEKWRPSADRRENIFGQTYKENTRQKYIYALHKHMMSI
jgi:hypothetical protein